MGKASRGSIQTGGGECRGGGWRIARWIVGIYHSRWRAVAARGTRQFTADRRTGGLVVPTSGKSSRDARTRFVPRIRVTQRVVRYVIVREVSVKREVFGRSIDRYTNWLSMKEESARIKVGDRFVVQCHVTRRA